LRARPERRPQALPSVDGIPWVARPLLTALELPEEPAEVEEPLVLEPFGN